MKEEAAGRGASAGIGDGEQPSANDGLRHFEGLGVGDQKEDQRRVKGVFGLEGQIRPLGWGRGTFFLAWRRGHSLLMIGLVNPGLCCGACSPSLNLLGVCWRDGAFGHRRDRCIAHPLL